MVLRYLVWILAGLFVLFGVVALMAGDTAGRRFWAGLATLSLGGWAVSLAADALATGRIRLRSSVIHRAHRPWLFRAAVGLVAAAGLVVLVGGVWILFVRS